MYEGSNLEMNQKKEKYHALPEWFLKKCKEEDYFEYNDVKKFAQNDPIVMGEIFEHIRCWGKKIAAVYANCQSISYSLKKIPLPSPQQFSVSKEKDKQYMFS